MMEITGRSPTLTGNLFDSSISTKSTAVGLCVWHKWRVIAASKLPDHADRAGMKKQSYLKPTVTCLLGTCEAS